MHAPVTLFFITVILSVAFSSVWAENNGRPIRIMPIGDSITRGTYRGYTALPNKQGGGWRKLLQDKLRKEKISFKFVGELDYWAYGENGVLDPSFSPKHHGLAGFSNAAIRNGGVVPTPADVLAAKGVKEIRVPGIAEALKRHRPDIVLLMSGSNGFNEKERDLLIKTICDNFDGELFVANIIPQQQPRVGWENVAKYNASLPGVVDSFKTTGRHIHYIDMNSVLSADDISRDGVHPNASGMEKIAQTWFISLRRHLQKGNR